MSDHESTASVGFMAEQFPFGFHMCYIYNDESERKQVVAKFLESGVMEGARAIYVADKATDNDVAGYLEEIGIDLPKVTRDDQLLTLCARNFYCPGDLFSPEQALDNVRAVKEESQAAGFPSIRFASEMDWALNGRPGSEKIIEYEVRLNIARRTYRSIGMCQYDARRFDGATLFDILRVHPMMIVRGQIVHNPYYIEPEEFLKECLGNQGDVR